jgi:hypothetical protein
MEVPSPERRGDSRRVHERKDEMTGPMPGIVDEKIPRSERRRRRGAVVRSATSFLISSTVNGLRSAEQKYTIVIWALTDFGDLEFGSNSRDEGREMTANWRKTSLF